ncbi:hypothetical protein GR255_27930 [Mycobacterium tuberculosis]|nr:hypothetical protein [Mycobacterium tuberculosis]
MTAIVTAPLADRTLQAFGSDTRRARALDDRLDRELDIEDDARGNDRREPPAV